MKYHHNIKHAAAIPWTISATTATLRVIHRAAMTTMLLFLLANMVTFSANSSIGLISFKTH